jgi:hypothetical protein
MMLSDNDRYRLPGRAARTLAVLGIGAGALAGAALAWGDAPQPASGSGLPALSDGFGDPATLAGWTVMQGDVQGGPPARYDVDRTAPGQLTIRPAYSWWVKDGRAFFLYRLVSGDFSVTTRLQATGVHGGIPQASWSLAGLLVRSPAGDADRAAERWVGWTAGAVRGARVFERKTTVNADSQLVLAQRSPGWVQLRVVRVADQLALLRRYPGGRWVLQWTYARPDLPAVMQVGIDAQSGWDLDRPGSRHPHDLVAHVDSIRFAETGIPDDVRAKVASGALPLRRLMPYLTR